MADGSTPSQQFPALGQLDLRSLLHEVVERVESVALLADRLQALLHAVVAIGSQLDLDAVLERITQTAAELATPFPPSITTPGIVTPSALRRT